jgi:transposase
MEPMLPGHVLFRKRVTRAKLIGFLAEQTPCVVAMEACAGAHYWAREIGKLGFISAPKNQRIAGEY